jgi:predicted MFS family arabinose efflux permease
VHLSAFVAVKGLAPSAATRALVLVGAGNVVGNWLAGRLFDTTRSHDMM